MNGFFDQPDKPVVAWRKYASKIDMAQQFQRDVLVLLPYMHEDYETFGGVEFNEIEQYYVKAIDDGCVELTENLMKIVIRRLARNEQLGKPLVDYLGSSFHYIVTTTKEHKASRGLRLRKTGKGRHKKLLERKRWSALAMHIYVLFLLDEADSTRDREANAEENFLNEAIALRSQLGTLKNQTPEQKVQVAELKFLIEHDDLLELAKKQWSFAKLMWDSISSDSPNGPDRPSNSFETIRRILTPGIELTPKGILQSYLRLLISTD